MSDTADQKTVLVTGASGAIGQAIVRRFVQDDYHVAIHFHQNSAVATALQAEVVAAGGVAQTFQADLCDAAAAKEMIGDVHKQFEHIDVLINNAGILDDALLGFMSDEQWHTVINANLNSVFYVTREVSMIMARQRRGKIISITSAAGRLGGAGRANYSAAKSGLSGFTRAVARELAGTGIQANTISPGYIDTAMIADLDERKRKDLLRQIPSRRLGEPQDVAELAAFLASAAADYITGQEISVDGGLYMG
jgi:NAD(P)-dependent dehydrogenase (short-subunit alcohol dehydrogenase family)